LSYTKQKVKNLKAKVLKHQAARARGALGDLAKLAKARRAEIQEKKNAMTGK
jgi:hypothetical protein